jgi:hypothetical protein
MSMELHATWDDRRTAKVSWNSCFSATRVPLRVSRQHEEWRHIPLAHLR